MRREFGIIDFMFVLKRFQLLAIGGSQSVSRISLESYYVFHVMHLCVDYAVFVLHMVLEVDAIEVLFLLIAPYGVVLDL